METHDGQVDLHAGLTALLADVLEHLDYQQCANLHADISGPSAAGTTAHKQAILDECQKLPDEKVHQILIRIGRMVVHHN